jgi:hypothetical protein
MADLSAHLLHSDRGVHTQTVDFGPYVTVGHPQSMSRAGNLLG